MQCRIKVYYCNFGCKILIFAEICKSVAVIPKQEGFGTCRSPLAWV